MRYDFVFASNFNLRNKSSYLKVKNGSRLVVDSDVSDCRGTISRESGAAIEGRDLGFVDGVFEDEGSKVQMFGYVQETSLNKIILNGNNVFRGERGTILQSIYVSNKNNRIEGEFYLAEDVVLQDSNTSLTIDFLGQISSNIELNSGSLYLEKNLSFLDNKRCVGPGIISLNGCKLSFGSQDLVWNDSIYFDDASDVILNSNIDLQDVWTFSGNSILDGNNNTLCFSGSGQIIVERGSSLLIKNLLIQDIGSDKIACMDNASTLTFQKVKLYEDSDYVFDVGNLEVLGSLKIYNGYKFIFRSQKPLKINNESTLTLDKGVTFSYDPLCQSKDLINFDNSSSILYLNGATLHTTVTGLQLKNGTMIVDGNSYLSSEIVTRIWGDEGLQVPESEVVMDNGITFGGDSQDEDFRCWILNGAKLELAEGTLVYKNYNTDSFDTYGALAILQFAAGTNFDLYQSITVGLGRFDFMGGTFVRYVDGKKILGGVNALGRIHYMKL